MRLLPSLLAVASTSLVASTMFATAANAHIDLLTPTPRYTRAESGENKACPCGKGSASNNRTCSVAAERSDPNRAAEARITTLESGSTLKLRFDEYVGHSGRYRVAIDFDGGADLEDFNQNILVDIPDPAGKNGNTGNGSLWEIEVPLPDVECDNCTLQLIQIMNGDTENPVSDPVGKSSYYTCADIVLTGGAPLPDAGPGSNPGPDAGEDVEPDPDPMLSEPSACGCQASSPGMSATTALGFALAFVFVGRRRRRRR